MTVTEESSCNDTCYSDVQEVQENAEAAGVQGNAQFAAVQETGLFFNLSSNYVSIVFAIETQM